MKNLFHIFILVILLVCSLPDRSFAVLQVHPAPPKQESFWKRLRQTSHKYILDVKARYKAVRKEGSLNRRLIGIGLLFTTLFAGIYLIFWEAANNTKDLSDWGAYFSVLLISLMILVVFFVIFLIGFIAEMLRIHSKKAVGK